MSEELANKLKAAGVRRFGSESAWRENLAKGGRKGGLAKVKKGFASNPEVARRAGRLGGSISKRRPRKVDKS